MSIGSVYWPEEIARRKESTMRNSNSLKNEVPYGELEKAGFEARKIFRDFEPWTPFFMVKYNSPTPVAVYYRTTKKVKGNWVYKKSQSRSHIGLRKKEK